MSGAHQPSLQRLLEQGKRLVSAGDVRRAARTYQLACLRYPFDPRPWIGLALSLKHLGELTGAERSLTAARVIGGDIPGTLAHRGECRLRQGRPGPAREDLERALLQAHEKGDPNAIKRSVRVLDWLDRTSAPEPQEVMK